MTNRFFVSDESPDNILRPYTVGIQEHPQSIATIILYSDELGSSPQTEQKNYLDPNNRETVDSVSSEVGYQNNEISANRISMSIPNLGEILASRPSYYDFKTNYGAYFGIFNNFSLLQVEENKDQIAKIHQNFGSSWNMFFFGPTPDMYNFSGLFLDTQDYPYYHEFMLMYDNFLSGHKCVENKFKMKIVYDGKIVGGYLLRIRTASSAESPHIKTFSFTVIVTDEEYMRDNIQIAADGATVLGLGFNAINNAHRVVKQYPMLLTQQQDQTAYSENYPTASQDRLS